MNDTKTIEKIQELIKKFPNDMDLGEEIRKIMRGNELSEAKKRLGVVMSELVMKNYLNGWLIKE